MRVLAPVRVVERHPVPLDSRPAQELIEAQLAFFRHDIAALAKRVERFYEPVDVGVPLQQAPVKPTDIAVLAIGIVVAPLGTAHLVAHEQHRRAGRQHLQREKVLDLAVAQRLDRRIVGRSFRAAVPAQIVIRTVAIVLAVGLVVLVVVRDQIIESKAVMAGYEIDALLGLAFLVTVNVRTAQAAGWPRRTLSRCRPRKKRRTSSRNRPFHSCQVSPTKLPT